MMKDVGIEEALGLERAVLVDVRSPGEFTQEHIPGAVNIPLFSDEERAEVGTAYKQIGPGAARFRGLAHVGPKLYGLVSEIAELSKDRTPVLYCWRGGERSQAIAQILDLMRISGYRITGGYKAYRQYVLARLQQHPTCDVAVVHGLTGVGKTDLLNALRGQGMPAIDLEGLANHRGSVFGGVGLGEQPGQKCFDSLLLGELEQFDQYGLILVESESRRIGRVYLPDRLYEKMKTGHHVLVYDQFENRVDRLYREYTANGAVLDVDGLERCLKGIQSHLGKKKHQEMLAMLQAGDIRPLISLLLSDYYDPLYGYPQGQDPAYDLCIDMSDEKAAIKAMSAWVDELAKGGRRIGLR